jgi:hypothetical protein
VKNPDHLWLLLQLFLPLHAMQGQMLREAVQLPRGSW